MEDRANYCNIVNATYNYLFAADSPTFGEDHLVEVRPDVSYTAKSLDQDKFWWRLEALGGQFHEGRQVYYIRNLKYGYLFVAEKANQKDGDDLYVETRPSPSQKDLQAARFRWTISTTSSGKHFWSEVTNLAHGKMFAARSKLHGEDHYAECRPSGDTSQLRFRWFVLDQTPLDRWMASLDDSRYLSELSLPGTHDSGTTNLPSGAGKTQTLDLSQQLRMGIRFLDCRLAFREGQNRSDTLVVTHGSIDGFPLAQLRDFTFEIFANTLVDFLATRKKECLVVSIKDELGSDDTSWRVFAKQVSKTIHSASNRGYWYTESRIPRLKDVGGKIVLLRRYQTTNEPNTGTSATADGAIGIDASHGWHRSSVITIGDVTLDIQDHYDYPEASDALDKKWPLVEAQLDSAKDAASSDPTLYLNFASASAPSPHLSPTPWDFASQINPKLLDYFYGESGAAAPCRFGIIPMDYTTSNIIAPIVASNPWR